MPLSKIYTNFLITDESVFIEAFHSKMQEVLKIPEYDRLVTLDQKEKGFYQPTNTTGKYILFEISLFSGRTIEAKRELYKSLIDLAIQHDVDPNNVRIVLNEVEMENWGIRGGQAASDVVLGFKTTV